MIARALMVLVIASAFDVAARAQSHDDDLDRLRATPTRDVADAVGARLHGDDQGLTALIDALARSPAWPQRRAAARLLGWAANDVAASVGLERLRLHLDASWPVREEAMLAIGDGGEGFIEAVVVAMRDPIIAVRLAAIRAAATSSIRAADEEWPALAAGLRGAMSDEARQVRLAAVTALASRVIVDTETRAAMIGALEGGLPPTLAREVVVGLVEGGHGSAVGSSAVPEWSSTANPFVRFVSALPALRLRPPGPCRPLPFERAVSLLESDEARSALGGELVDLLRTWLPRDNAATTRFLLEASRTPDSRAVCRLVLGRLEADGNPSRFLCEAMLDDVFQARDPVVTALDELAAAPIEGQGDALERFIVGDHEDREARRTALRILLARGHSFTPEAATYLRGPAEFQLAVEYAAHRWTAGDAADRREVVEDTRRWFAAPTTLRFAAGVLLRICRDPRPEAASLLRERLPTSTHRLKSSIIDALAGLGDAGSAAALRSLLSQTDDMAGVHRIERHLVGRGDESVVNEILRRAQDDDESWEGSSLDDLITLRSVEDDRVTVLVEGRLDRRRFDDRTLPHLIDIVSERRGRAAAVERLREILERAAGDGEWPGRARQPLSGNVIAHLLESLGAGELAPLAIRSIETGRVTQAASVLDAVADLGDIGIADMLVAAWEATPPGPAHFERRAALLAPLVRRAGDAGLAIVRREFARGLAALDDATRHLDLRAEIVAQAAGVLVRDGGDVGIMDVARAVADSRDEDIVTILLWAFTEARDVATVESVLADLVDDSSFSIPPETLAAWAESAVAHRSSGHPIVFIAEMLLARPIQRAVASPRALTGLASRLTGRRDDGLRDLARRLLERAYRLIALRPGRDPGRMALHGPTAATPTWRNLVWRRNALVEPGAVVAAMRTPYWAARADVEYVLDKLRIDASSSRRMPHVLDVGLGTRSAEVLTSSIRYRIAAGAASTSREIRIQELERALARASELAAASRVIPAGSQIHAHPDYEILEASALWHLGREDDALGILRRHGWPRRKSLPELTADAFPRLEPR